MENLDKNQVYVVGVSGGSDSMALLDLARKANLKLVVAHMNYLKRDSATRDEMIVRNYCAKYQLICEVRHQKESVVGNFQAFARKKRYQFYQELCNQYQAKGVLIAHHLDDVIETYLIQKQRNSQCDYYGIKAEVMIQNVMVYRLLLNKEKQQLLDYCIQNQIPFGIDESNLSNDYTRNRIRHEVVENMSLDEKLALKQEIDTLNKQLILKREKIDAFLKQWKHDFHSLQQQKDCIEILERWIYFTTSKHYSRKEIEMIYNMCRHNNFQRTLDENYEVEFAYGFLYIYERKNISYHYEINKLEALNTPYFKLRKEGKVIEGITVDEKELPLFIRPYQNGDKIKLRIGTKKVNRFFIDRKIPKHLRLNYPVVLNNQQEVIFVYGIGCEIKHFSNNPSIFVVQ